MLDGWKKKIDENFTEDKFSKLICIMNSVSNLSKNNSIVFHDGLKINWKISAIQYAYELIKGDINDIKRGILEFIEKKRRNREKTSKIVTFYLLRMKVKEITRQL
jgi:hypothetical protein